MKKWLWCLWFMISPVFAAMSVIDDAGRTVILPQSAKRIISLSPHATELVFAAGAGAQLVGVTRYSDFPAEARKIQLIGDFRQIDLERVLALKPDLVIAWKGGNPSRQIDVFHRVGIPVFYSDPRYLKDIPDNIIRLGILSGHQAFARKRALKWSQQMNKLSRRYGNQPSLSVFYQVSDMPLFTLNGKHIVNEVIQLCGGRNIFADLPVLAPNVNMEAVLAANPEVIISSKGVSASSNGLSAWKRFKILKAVHYGNLFGINPDWLDRPGPRMLEGTGMLCKKLEEGRKNRSLKN